MRSPALKIKESESLFGLSAYGIFQYISSVSYEKALFGVHEQLSEIKNIYIVMVARPGPGLLIHTNKWLQQTQRGTSRCDWHVAT